MNRVHAPTQSNGVHVSTQQMMKGKEKEIHCNSLSCNEVTFQKNKLCLNEVLFEDKFNHKYSLLVENKLLISDRSTDVHAMQYNATQKYTSISPRSNKCGNFFFSQEIESDFSENSHEFDMYGIYSTKKRRTSNYGYERCAYELSTGFENHQKIQYSNDMDKHIYLNDIFDEKNFTSHSTIEISQTKLLRIYSFLQQNSIDTPEEEILRNNQIWFEQNRDIYYEFLMYCKALDPSGEEKRNQSPKTMILFFVSQLQLFLKDLSPNEYRSFTQILNKWVDRVQIFS